AEASVPAGAPAGVAGVLGAGTADDGPAAGAWIVTAGGGVGVRDLFHTSKVSRMPMEIAIAAMRRFWSMGLDQISGLVRAVGGAAGPREIGMREGGTGS
ncbi:MAG: hypothetical protein JWR00_3532, partial [Rubritepida sp.]|nr:hypothetical protein [Rubritepida sp.]